MKISGYGPTTGPAQTRRAGKTDKSSSNSFAKELSGAVDFAEETHAAEAPATMGNIDALLAVQASGDSLEREQRRRLIRHGEDLLDKLEEIRHGLLLGTVSKEKLISLAQMVRSRRGEVADPRLAGLLDEIELRAEVELAKLSPRSFTES